MDARVVAYYEAEGAMENAEAGIGEAEVEAERVVAEALARAEEINAAARAARDASEQARLEALADVLDVETRTATARELTGASASDVTKATRIGKARTPKDEDVRESKEGQLHEPVPPPAVTGVAPDTDATAQERADSADSLVADAPQASVA